MSNINAQSIINEVMQAHAIAPSEYTWGDFVTFKTSERGTHRIINDKAHLQRFADAVRKNAAAFGGGLIREAKTAPAVSYASKTISLYKQLIEDKDWYAALQLAEEKLAPLFFVGTDGKAYMQVAPIPCEFEPRLVSAMNEDGKWAIVDPVSMIQALGNSRKNLRSRDAQIAEVKSKFDSMTFDKVSAIFAKIATVKQDQSAIRTQWMQEHGIIDDAAIEARIEAQAAQDVAEVVAQAVAVSAIAEAMAPAAEDEKELVTCEAGESESNCASIAQFINVAADSVGTLRKIDVSRVIDEAPTQYRKELAAYIQYNRPDLEQEVADVLEEITPTPTPAVSSEPPATRPVESTNFAADIPLSLAVSAFGGVSMSPERRGASAQAEYAQSMKQDYDELRKQAEKGGTLDLLEDVFSKYNARQSAAYRAYLASSSRCISSFITGPSNFPVARANKRNDIAHKRLNDYLDGGQVAFRAAVRTLRPDLRAIMSGDADAIDRLTIELAKLERGHESMKAANKAIRDHAKDGEARQVDALMELGFSESKAIELLHPMRGYSQGFQSFTLTNNQANIRRIRARLAQITAAKARPVEKMECYNGITFEDDAPANRVRLYFPGKPDEATRTELKSHGFRWSPTLGAWQAYRNYQTITTAKRMAGEPTKATQDEAPKVAEVAQIEPTTPPMESTEVSTPSPEPVPAVEIEATTPAAESQPEPVAPVVGTEYDDTPCVGPFDIPACISVYDHEGHLVYSEDKDAPKVIDRIARLSPQEPAPTPDDTAKFNIRAKSGQWFACVYMIGTVYGLRFEAKGMEPITGEFTSHQERMQALEMMASALNTPPDGGIEPVDAPTEAPTPPVAECTPGAPVAVSTASDAPLHPRNIVPTNGVHIVDDAFEAWTYQSGARFGFVMYLGKSAKPWKYYGYKSEAARDDGFQRHAAEARDIAAFKAKRKAEDKAKAEQGHGLQVGDVVRSSWGYDQTNVNHYQITKLIGKRTVEVRELVEHKESTGDMSGRVAPVWGEFVGEPMRRTVDKYGHVNILREKFGRASKIEPVAIVHGVRCYASTGYSNYA